MPASPKVKPITLSELKSDVRPITVKYLQHEIELSYRPSSMTAEFYAAMRETESQAPSEMVVRYARDLLVSWSIVDENDVPLPITEDSLRLVPTDLLWAITDAVREDLRPKEASATA